MLNESFEYIISILVYTYIKFQVHLTILKYILFNFKLIIINISLNS